MVVNEKKFLSSDFALINASVDMDRIACVINDPNGDFLASRFGFYFLPENRPLRPFKYLAFYKADEITHVYLVTDSEPIVTRLADSELLQRVSVITNVQADVNYQIFKLKYYKALAPVVNDLIDKDTGRSLPYTLYHRYTDIKKLVSAFHVSQLNDVFTVDLPAEVDYSYINRLKEDGFPVPEDEKARVEELNQLDIWGSEIEPEFDNLTRLASFICKAPVAMIALIGQEEAWLKAETGVDGRPVSPRNLSFCQYTIMGDDILEVPDALQDARFAENPYVLGEPRIRFYAAAPLITEKGNKIGTLCVTNSCPQQLTDEQRSELRRLANEAVLRIQLRKKNKDLENANGQLEVMLQELNATQNHTFELYQSLGDSIRYARRIQEAVFPTEATLRGCMENAFVIYHPKDIVSGDFYTIFQRRNKVFISVGDCTGHGVPGAFMTFIGINAIHKIINERGISEPANILEELDDEITRVLHQEAGSTYNRDGMDIAFCVIDTDRWAVSVGSAQRPVWLVRDQEIKELKGDRFPIAGGYSEKKIFTSVMEKIQPGDNLYLFSDGITDQFGFYEERIQKYSYRRLRELLTRIHRLPMTMQKTEIEKELKNWRQDTPQTDDQLFIGIKF